MAVAACLLVRAAKAESLELPAEVTPTVRAACEQDVRRLCLGDSPTVASVASCMARRYGELSMRCKIRIAAAGLAPAGR